jgi:hypothetical protein
VSSIFSTHSWWARAEQHQPVHPMLDQGARHARFRLRVVLVACHQQHVARLIQGALQRLDGLGEDGVVERGQDRAYRARAARGERARRAVRDVAQRLHRLVDAGCRRGLDLCAAGRACAIPSRSTRARAAPRRRAWRSSGMTCASSHSPDYHHSGAGGSRALDTLSSTLYSPLRLHPSALMP